MYRLQEEKGQALILVALMLLIGLVIAGSLSVMGLNQLRMSCSQIDMEKAYYIAEAGVELAILVMSIDPYWEGTGGEVAYADGTYEIQKNGDSFISIGHYRNAKKSLRVSMDVFRLENEGVWPGLCTQDEELTFASNHSIYSPLAVAGDLNLNTSAPTLSFSSPGLLVEGDLVISDNLEIDITGGGKAQVGGSVSLSKNNAAINGNVELQDELNISRGSINGNVVYKNGPISVPEGAVSGTLEQDTSLAPPDIPAFPTLEEDKYRLMAMAQGQYYEGPTCITFSSDETIRGYYFVEGDVEVEGDYRGNACLVATGQITISGDLKPVNRDNGYALTLITTDTESGDLFIENNAYVEALVICSKLMTVGHGQAEFHGAASVMGFDDRHGRLKFYYDDYFFTECGPGMGPGITSTVTSRRENYPIY